MRPGDILVGKVSPKSKTELTPEEKLLHAIFGRAGEDVKNDSLEVPVRHRRHRHRHPEVLAPDEPVGRRAQEVREGTEGRGGGRQHGDRAGLHGAWSRSWKRSSAAPLTDEDGTPLTGNQDPKYLAERAQQFRLQTVTAKMRSAGEDRRGRTRLQDALAGCGNRDRRSRPQAQQHEARRRTAQRRAADGQGVHRDQARDLGRRQDGRPARQQGRHRQDPAGGGHAVSGGRHAAADHAQPAGRAQSYERGTDSRNAPGLGRRRLGFQAITPVFDGASEEDINVCLDDARACRATARRGCSTAGPATRSIRKRRSATSTC